MTESTDKLTPMAAEILTACGFDSLYNDKNHTAQLIINVVCTYRIWGFDLSCTANTILKYNGLTVDAAHAIRKSMKEYDFYGGFHFSLEYILNESNSLHDEFVLAQRYSGQKLFPVGKVFSQIMSLDEQGKVYADERCIADSFEDFIEKLTSNFYKNNSKRKTM